METESWRDVVGYSNLYRVSDRGNMLITKTKKPRVMRTSKNKIGFLVAILTNSENKRIHHVSRLVANAFFPELGFDNKRSVLHINSDYSDSDIENLIVIDSENERGVGIGMCKPERTKQNMWCVFGKRCYYVDNKFRPVNHLNSHYVFKTREEAEDKYKEICYYERGI